MAVHCGSAETSKETKCPCAAKLVGPKGTHAKMSTETKMSHAQITGSEINPKPNLKLNAGLIYNDFDDDSLVSIKMTMQKFFIYEEIDMKNEEQF